MWDLLKFTLDDFFIFHPDPWEKMIQFDYRIFFKLGWFNHQREIHSLKRPTKALCASNQQDYVFIDGLGLEIFSAPMKNWEGGKLAFWESIHNSSSFFLECFLSWRSLIFKMNFIKKACLLRVLPNSICSASMDFCGKVLLHTRLLSTGKVPEHHKLISACTPLVLVGIWGKLFAYT